MESNRILDSLVGSLVDIIFMDDMYIYGQLSLLIVRVTQLCFSIIGGQNIQLRFVSLPNL